MMSRLTGMRSFAFGLLLLVLGGCTSAVFRQPEVTVDGVQVGGLGLRGGTLLVDLRVVNPNRFSLGANQLTYTLQLDQSDQPGDTTWVDFAQGIYDRPFEVDAGETSTVQIPVEFTYAGLGSAAGSILRAGTFNFRASGSVAVRTPLGTRDVPFRKQGTFTLAGVK